MVPLHALQTDAQYVTLRRRVCWQDCVSMNFVSTCHTG